MAAAVLFALFFEQFYSGKYYVTRGQFWILPIIMLGCSVLEIIEEFYVEFEIITIGFILFSMYSLGIHVPQVVMMMVILLRIPAITAGCAIGTGLWIGIKQFDKAQSCKQIGSWMDLYHWNICCGGKLYIFAVIFEERVREKI